MNQQLIITRETLLIPINQKIKERFPSLKLPDEFNHLEDVIYLMRDVADKAVWSIKGFTPVSNKKLLTLESAVETIIIEDFRSIGIDPYHCNITFLDYVDSHLAISFDYKRKK